VALFAIVAIGGIAVPLSVKTSTKEVLHFANTSGARAIITNASSLQIAKEVASNYALDIIVSEPYLFTTLLDPLALTFSSGRVPDQNAPALVIFTSGSTGRPKGAAIRRYDVYCMALNVAKRIGISPGAGFNCVQVLPMHHATGLLVNTLPAILGGGCVEFMNGAGGFDAGKVWERWRAGGVATFNAVPTMYVLLLRHWDDVISKLSFEEQDDYQRAVRNMNFSCSTSALQRAVAERWKILSGKRIMERFGGTEFGTVFTSYPGIDTPYGSVGTPTYGVESKLSHGLSGEILVRSPFLFLKYINDPSATKQAFDNDGFFKTGDLARRKGDFYYITGLIKSGGYKISALDVEAEILEHPKVEEVVVVGVKDSIWGERVAAGVVLCNKSDKLTLGELREWLRLRISNYKMPTLLRIVKELEKTETMKVPKARVGRALFEAGSEDVQRWDAVESKNGQVKL